MTLCRKFVTSHNLQISYLERTAAIATKPPIVLLHGLIAEAEVFRRLIAELPSDRRIVALDLPGAGYSDRPAATDVSFAGMAAVVHEVISALGLRKPILLGHSHGGAIALQLAVSHPEVLSALILICPAHPFSKHEDKLVGFWLSGIGRRLARVVPRLPRQLHLFAFRRMPGSRAALGYAELEPYLHTLKAPGTVPHIMRLLESWQPDMVALGTALQQRPVQLPTCLLWGDRDIVVPVSTFVGLLACLSQGEMTTLRGLGHLPNEEAPEECGRILGGWLQQLENTPANQ